MKSNWREAVIASCNTHTYIDPCLHGLNNESEYTLWDLLGVSKCDIVFSYLELSNPSGVGLALETGYAKALGKTIIFVDERGDPRFGIVRASSDICVNTLEEGINILKSLERL